MILETKRLILRPWEETDAAECFRYAREADIGPSAGWLPHESVEYSREIIRTMLSEPETYAVVLKETGLPVGSVGIMLGGARGGLREREAELGCWIGKPYWGQGYIPEAIRALTERCFSVFDCEAVWYACFEGNEKSRRVAEKCGFRYDHTEKNTPWPVGARDELYFVLRRKDRAAPDPDLTLAAGRGLVNIRVGAIILKEGKLLMVGNDRSDYLYSVGGRVRFGESAEQAVVREVLEETGVRLEVDRLGFVHELFFADDAPPRAGVPMYEISFYFYMKTPADFEPTSGSFTEDGVGERLVWIAPDSERTYYPAFLRTELAHPSRELRHIVTKETSWLPAYGDGPLS